ncbi:hypothetical protein F442_14568 [Phytophthora nicotianae P10297]|uniref:Uncharacterized protein n=3 Tax=Phytophthora nicotianae TaxID=4792 RepID=W2PBG9_PHYN3|nr:hypothetical protein PPTG_24630 [Phytophthora nicotianae INRA-310]ETK93492.1 hypothetical protein L915_03343 [Phytophthora nicotianae]ETL82055.1 hypothetical protein L917_17722 [Phytophthora nicotianae]ETM98387.1 hypothetical protein PPTG_24630 [Phytophthora nicotianae INRA-310]ETP37644.1 hypothetical protein F442_14568 [Phytophthora nicotianae P10297]
MGGRWCDGPDLQDVSMKIHRVYDTLGKSVMATITKVHASNLLAIVLQREN